MARTAWTSLAVLLLLWPGHVAADANLVGTWRVRIAVGGQQPTLWLVRFESKDGKLAGTVLDTMERFPKGEIAQVKTDGDRLSFTMQVGPEVWSFDGKRAAEGPRRILGTLDMAGRQFALAQLEASNLKSLDRYELYKEQLAQAATPSEIFDAIPTLLAQAAAKGARVEEVRSWADKGYRAAEAYGSRWQREIALRTAEALAGQKEYAPVAVEYARRAERLLEPDADTAAQVRTLDVLARALEKSGKQDEARDLRARSEKLEARAHQEHTARALPFKPTAFGGRKAAGSRAVLVELFTGAQCPPCVAADMAFDALGQTYKSTEVVLLQYHLHIPGPDPLTNPASEARQRYYESDIEGTPTIFFSGKPVAGGGGSAEDAHDKYKEYRAALEPLLEKPAPARLTATARRQGDTIEIAAEVTEVAEPGDRVRLRFALVEEWVRYRGRNNLPYHHHVVRAMPGGPEGIPVKGKSLKQTVAVALPALRKELTDYLDSQRFPDDQRPLGLRPLRVVAFVQNDATKEVLQAVQVAVDDGTR